MKKWKRYSIIVTVLFAMVCSICMWNKTTAYEGATTVNQTARVDFDGEAFIMREYAYGETVQCYYKNENSYATLTKQSNGVAKLTLVNVDLGASGGCYENFIWCRGDLEIVVIGECAIGPTIAELSEDTRANGIAVIDGNLKIYGGSKDETVDKFTINCGWNGIQVGSYTDADPYDLDIKDVAIEVNFVKENYGCDAIFSYGDLTIDKADITLNEIRVAGIYSDSGDLMISNSKIKGSTYIKCDERNDAYPIIGISTYEGKTFSITDCVLELYCRSEYATAINWLNGDFLRNKVTITTDFPIEHEANYTTGIVFSDEVKMSDCEFYLTDLHTGFEGGNVDASNCAFYMSNLGVSSSFGSLELKDSYVSIKDSSHGFTSYGDVILTNNKVDSNSGGSTIMSNQNLTIYSGEFNIDGDNSAPSLWAYQVLTIHDGKYEINSTQGGPLCGQEGIVIYKGTFNFVAETFRNLMEVDSGVISSDKDIVIHNGNFHIETDAVLESSFNLVADMIQAENFTMNGGTIELYTDGSGIAMKKNFIMNGGSIAIYIEEDDFKNANRTGLRANNFKLKGGKVYTSGCGANGSGLLGLTAYCTGSELTVEVNGDNTYGIFLNNKLVVKDSVLTISAKGTDTAGVMIYVPETAGQEGEFGVFDVSGNSQVRINTTKDAVQIMLESEVKNAEEGRKYISISDNLCCMNKWATVSDSYWDNTHFCDIGSFLEEGREKLYYYLEADRLVGSAKSITILPLCATHSYTSKVTKEATCEDKGVRKYTCSMCGHYYKKSIAAKGHSYKTKVVKPTYTSEGYTEYTCTKCGKYDQKDHTQMVPIPTTSFLSTYTATSDSITLNWKKNKEASGYCIYQYDTMSEKWTKIATVDSSKTSYKVKKLRSGVEYKFRISLYMVIDGYKYYSEKSPVLKAVTKIDTVTWKNYSATTTSVTLKWNKNANATGYRIYRYDSKTKKWNTVKTITSGNETSYKVSGLKAGTSCSFRIKAYVSADGKTNWSAYSENKKITTKPAKAAISKLSTPKKKAIKATWKKVSGATGYEVQISKTKKFNSKSKYTKTYKTTSLSKTISSLSKGTYYIRVRAYRTVEGVKQYGSWSTIKGRSVK